MSARLRFVPAAATLALMEAQAAAIARAPQDGGKVSFVLAADANGYGRAGQLVTLDLAPADVHDPTELSSYLAGYRPFGFRADEISPVVLVDHGTDKYRTFHQDDAFQRVDVKTGIEAKVPEIETRSALAQYTVVERAIGAFIADRVEMEATGLYKPKQAAMKRCQRVLQLDREIDLATLLTTAGSWAAGFSTTLGATAKWNGGSASDPILNLQTVEETSAQEVTGYVMTNRTANAMLRHPAVRDHMRQHIGDGAANTALQQVNRNGRVNRDFEIPGLAPIRVTAAKVKNDTSGALDWIWGNDVVALAIPPGVPTDGEDISTTYTMRIKGDAGNGYVTREYRDEARGARGGTFVVCTMADIALMTGNNCGGLLKAAWQ